MFRATLRQLGDDVRTIHGVLATTVALQMRLFSKSALSREEHVVAELQDLQAVAPPKLDWQIYDHCAAVTRLYAAYERFVSELVSEYIRVLPQLYETYGALPDTISVQHRVGIGHILLKMGKRGLYKELEASAIVSGLSRGLSGDAEYTLLAEAFFVDRQNLRFGTLVRLFSSLGFRNCQSRINCHPAILSFIKEKRGDNSSVQKELEELVEYRNEAAHRKVENLLSHLQFQQMGAFILVLADVLAEMVEEGIFARKVKLKQFASLLKVEAIHYGGQVVIGKLKEGVIKVGDEVVIAAGTSYKRAVVESIQVDEKSFDQVAPGQTEIGLKLTSRASQGCELLKIEFPLGPRVPIQLSLEDATSPIADDVVTQIETQVTKSVEHEKSVNAG